MRFPNPLFEPLPIGSLATGKLSLPPVASLTSAALLESWGAVFSVAMCCVGCGTGDTADCVPAGTISCRTVDLVGNRVLGVVGAAGGFGVVVVVGCVVVRVGGVDVKDGRFGVLAGGGGGCRSRSPVDAGCGVSSHSTRTAGVRPRDSLGSAGMTSPGLVLGDAGMGGSC